MHDISTHTPSSPLQYIPSISIGWVGVGWRRRCKTRELDNEGTVFFSSVFGGHHGWRSSWIIFVRGTLTPHKGDDRVT